MSEEVKREVQTWDPVEWLDRIINGEQTYTLQEVPGNSGHYKLVPDNVEVIQKGTELDIEVDKLRSYLRLSANPELKYLSVDKYGNWAAMVDEIGRMVGGWIQSVSK